ncbi:hypothetical protein OE88DRAFT_1656242 [Heliocybe sulcata]|uniref:Uncharacterized protein n=1 Tax=Heliocybe sulcata TaxID=5364 RepID=A0A5C3N6P3_9AGAM|nr:hypothetical protein OE88DRAFT_1656242 [Heliocybe sulcata]
MSTSYNPFAQSWSTGGSPPSVFGALPYPQSPPPPVPNSVLFVFTEFYPSILNCSVKDNRSATLFRVATETNPRYTFVKDREGRSVAALEWHTHPSVEVRGVVPKQEVRAWLALSRDARCVVVTCKFG